MHSLNDKFDNRLKTEPLNVKDLWLHYNQLNGRHNRYFLYLYNCRNDTDNSYWKLSNELRSMHNNRCDSETMPVPNRDLMYDTDHNLLINLNLSAMDWLFDCNYQHGTNCRALMYLHNHRYDKQNIRLQHVLRLTGS